MSRQFESMMEGLTDLLEYARGDISKARTRSQERESPKICSSESDTDIPLQQKNLGEM